MADLMDVMQPAYLGDAETAATEAQTLAARAAAFGPRDTVAAWATYVHGEVLIDLDPPRAQDFLDEALDRRPPGRRPLPDGRHLRLGCLATCSAWRPSRGCPLYVDVIDHWFTAGDWTHQWTTMRNIVDLLARLEAYEPLRSCSEHSTPEPPRRPASVRNCSAPKPSATWSPPSSHPTTRARL